MQLIKNNSTSSQLAQRLELCVNRVGGKRAMATATLISEAQLFRYLSGESDLPAERLIAVAKAANVDPGWLLTGEGDMVEGAKKDTRPAFRSELMVQLTQTLDELLIEFEKPFNPRQRARVLTFLYNAFRHEETMRGIEYMPQKFDLLKSINYLSELRSEEELDVLNSALSLLEYPKEKKPFTDEQLELLRVWCNLTVRGTKGYYSSYPGQVYFERKSGGQLESTAVLDLQNLVSQACQSLNTTQLNWLDLGCGSGRHLTHLAKHFPNISLKGVELSQLGFKICKELMDSEKLPHDCVIMADMRQLPFSSQSFDVVYANLSLYCLPYLPGTGIGLEEAMSELSRVTRKNGLAKLTFPMGDWRDYSMSFQYLNSEDLRNLAILCEMDVVSFVEEIVDLKPVGQSEGNVAQKLKLNHRSYLHVTLRKK